jgi:hypothetical protein
VGSALQIFSRLLQGEFAWRHFYVRFDTQCAKPHEVIDDFSVCAPLSDTRACNINSSA